MGHIVRGLLEATEYCHWWWLWRCAYTTNPEHDLPFSLNGKTLPQCGEGGAAITYHVGYGGRKWEGSQLYRRDLAIWACKTIHILPRGLQTLRVYSAPDGRLTGSPTFSLYAPDACAQVWPTEATSLSRSWLGSGARQFEIQATEARCNLMSIQVLRHWRPASHN